MARRGRRGGRAEEEVFEKPNGSNNDLSAKKLIEEGEIQFQTNLKKNWEVIRKGHRLEFIGSKLS